MKSGIEKRVSAAEKRCNRLGKIDFEVITCPHVLFIGEKPPCATCDKGQSKRRICTHYVKPTPRP